jgi:hypothetical protein
MKKLNTPDLGRESLALMDSFYRSEGTIGALKFSLFKGE